MKLPNERSDTILESKLANFRLVPERDAEAAAKGREAFLAEVQALSTTTSARSSVSATRPRRLNSWKEELTNLFRRKERSFMPTIISTLLVLSLLAGGAGATVVASQDSLPGQTFYALKTLGEDLRLEFTGDQETQLRLNLEYAQRRIIEWGILVRMGEAMPEDSLQRYEHNLDQALATAAGMSDVALALAFQEMITALSRQQQALEELSDQPGAYAQGTLLRAREMLQLRLQWVAAGRTDAAAFREQVRRHSAERKSGGTPPGGFGDGYGPGLHATTTPTPGGGYGPGPHATTTPTQGDGYGPGPHATITPTPGDGYGPGPNPSHTPGDGDGYGPGPHQPTNTPGGGPGPGPNPSQTPPGDCDGCGGCPCPSQTPDGRHHGPAPSSTPGPGDGDHGPGPNPSPGPTDDQGPGDGGNGPGQHPDECTPEPGGPGDCGAGDSGGHAGGGKH